MEDQTIVLERKKKKNKDKKIKYKIGLEEKFWFGIIAIKYANITSMPPI